MFTVSYARAPKNYIENARSSLLSKNKMMRYWAPYL